MYPSANAATPYIFPSPLNATFTAAFWNSPSRRNSTKNETDNLLRSAAYDLPKPLWGIGSDGLELHAGDEIHVKWEGDNVIDLTWYCLICTLGVETGEVWSACDNYTKSVSTFISTASNHGPLGPIIAPSFSQWNTPIPPEETCGLCFLTQFENHLGWANTGYTIPFPVLAANRTVTSPSKQSNNFSTEHPAGTLLPYIPTVTSISYFSTATSIPKIPNIKTRGRSGRRGRVTRKQAIIIGSTMGVVALLVLLWPCWGCTGDSRANRWVTARAEMMARTRAMEVRVIERRPDSREMEVRGVERRPDSSEMVVREVERRVSEPPPAYHEVIRGGGREA